MAEDDDDSGVGPTRRVKRLGPARPTAAAPPLPPSALPPFERDYHDELRDARKACIDAGGEVFGTYVLLGEVGKGGMAEVRLAVEMLDLGAVRLCVIKRTKPNGDQRVVHDEGRILGRLEHPGIVKLYASGTIEERAFLAFELIDGLSLRQIERLMARQPMTVATSVEIGAAAAEALAYVHEAKTAEGAPLDIVHRDISPENVLVSRSGEIKLVDFGIARFSDRGQKTRQGLVKGKLGYLAPEQMGSGTGTIVPATDVYALGLLIAELVAWQRIFPPKMIISADTALVVRDRCASAPRPVPRPLVDLLVEMTEADPRDRPSAREAAQALNAIGARNQEGPTVAELAKERLFAKLLPLDLSTVLEVPTKRVTKLDAEDTGGEGAHYSSTVEVLAKFRRRS